MSCFALNLQGPTWDVEHATFRVERDQIDSELLQVERKRIFVRFCVCVCVLTFVVLMCDSSVVCSRWELAVQ